MKKYNKGANIQIVHNGNNWITVMHNHDEHTEKVFDDEENALLQQLIWELDLYQESAPHYNMIKERYPQLLQSTQEGISINDNMNLVRKILHRLYEDEHCPCNLLKNDDTICMCADFRQKDKGYCHCGLYYKESKGEK